MSNSLCQRCSSYSSCCLDYDGKCCRNLRDVEPTVYDKIQDMDIKTLAEFLADWAFYWEFWKIFPDEVRHRLEEEAIGD